MKIIELIFFLEKSVNDHDLIAFLETNHFDLKKLPRQERSKNQSSKVLCPIFLLHGIELRFGFEKEVLELYEIVLFQPKSDGLQKAHEIEYPFGLYPNQKVADYEAILGDFTGFDEPQLREYQCKKYKITIVFEPKDLDKKIKKIEISIIQNEN